MIDEALLITHERTTILTLEYLCQLSPPLSPTTRAPVLRGCPPPVFRESGYRLDF